MDSQDATLARSPVHDFALGEIYQEESDRFVQSLAVKAANTRRNYLTGTKSFLAFLEERWGAPDLEALTREHAEEWVRYLLEECRYAAATVHGHAVGARVFCKRLVENDVLDRDPFEKVEIPQAAMPPVEILTPDDVQGMVNAARRERTIWGRRDVAVMLLLYSGGLRQQELLNVAEQDIDWKRGSISVMGRAASRVRWRPARWRWTPWTDTTPCGSATCGDCGGTAKNASERRTPRSGSRSKGASGARADSAPCYVYGFSLRTFRYAEGRHIGAPL